MPVDVGKLFVGEGRLTEAQVSLADGHVRQNGGSLSAALVALDLVDDDEILVGATAVEIRRKALEEGMLTLRASGLRKIREGVTTIEEVRRETVA